MISLIAHCKRWRHCTETATFSILHHVLLIKLIKSTGPLCTLKKDLRPQCKKTLHIYFTWKTELIGRKASLLLPQNRICSLSLRCVSLIYKTRFPSTLYFLLLFTLFLLCLITFLCYVLCDFKVLSWINFPNCMQMIGRVLAEPLFSLKRIL